MATPFQLQH